jgi:DNA repair protein SbcD/Mre11
MSVGPVSFLVMPRLLHTSDWHLGRSFHREDLLGAQAGYVDHLIETIRSERVDCVVIAGDLYDRALPSVDAVTLCGEAMKRIHAEGVRIVLISGNHDSAQRLGFGAGLMDAAGVHVRTDPARVGEPVVVDDVAIYGIPYLEPDLLRTPWQLRSRSHTAALTEAMRRIRADLATRPAGTRAVVAAHAFVSGGDASDSERDISVGGVAQVPVSVFDGIDYVALGHLHGRQRMSDSVRYSGSPLAYSFSEEHQVKGSWLVDPGRAAEFVPAPVPRQVARIEGRLDELLNGDRWSRYEDHWLQVTLTDPERPRAAMDRLRTRFPHVLALAFAPDGGPRPGLESRAARMQGRSESELALDFVADVRGEPANEAERLLLQEAFDAFRVKEASR